MSSDEPGHVEIQTQRDRRLREMDAYEEDGPIEMQTEEIDQRIEAVHRRLLEAATAGGLTWVGDRIIRRTRLPGDCNQCPLAEADPCGPHAEPPDTVAVDPQRAAAGVVDLPTKPCQAA